MPVVLNNPVSRGKLWGNSYSWGEAITAHAEACSGGCCRFLVTEDGIWIEGDASRSKVYRTRIPKGAEPHAKQEMDRVGLVPSTRTKAYRVAPIYA